MYTHQYVLYVRVFITNTHVRALSLLHYLQMEERWQRWEEHSQRVKEEEEERKRQEEEEKRKRMEKREKIFKILQSRDEGWLMALCTFVCVRTYICGTTYIHTYVCMCICI